MTPARGNPSSLPSKATAAMASMPKIHAGKRRAASENGCPPGWRNHFHTVTDSLDRMLKNTWLVGLT